MGIIEQSAYSVIYKLFMMIIANRIKPDVYREILPSQAAYQSNRGTTEQIFSVQQVIEKSVEFNNPALSVSMDFTKAFDSEDQREIWKALDKTPINKRYIVLLKAFYSHSTAQIKTDLGVTRAIEILKDVKQGDVLAAILFILVIAGVIEHSIQEAPVGYLLNS